MTTGAYKTCGAERATSRLSRERESPRPWRNHRTWRGRIIDPGRTTHDGRTFVVTGASGGTVERSHCDRSLRGTNVALAGRSDGIEGTAGMSGADDRALPVRTDVADEGSFLLGSRSRHVTARDINVDAGTAWHRSARLRGHERPESGRLVIRRSRGPRPRVRPPGARCRRAVRLAS